MLAKPVSPLSPGSLSLRRLGQRSSRQRKRPASSSVKAGDEDRAMADLGSLPFRFVLIQTGRGGVLRAISSVREAADWLVSDWPEEGRGVPVYCR